MKQSGQPINARERNNYIRSKGCSDSLNSVCPGFYITVFARYRKDNAFYKRPAHHD